MGERAKAVVIHGLRDLLGTSLITALNARGFDVTRAEQTAGPAIALVDPSSSEADERTTRCADRPKGTLHPDLGARGRRNPGLRVLLGH